MKVPSAANRDFPLKHPVLALGDALSRGTGFGISD